MGGKRNRTNCIRGLYPKRDKFVWQPPMIDGVRPAAVWLNTSDFAEAVALVEEIRHKAVITAIETEIPDLVKVWLAAKAKSKKHKGKVTTDTARRALKRFTNRFSALEAIAGRDLEDWRAEMIAERRLVPDPEKPDGPRVASTIPALSIATINGYLRYSQSFCSWAAAQGHLFRSPFLDAHDLFPTKLPTKRADFCTKEERDRLIRNCTHLDLKAVIFFGCHAGLRRQEILNLRPSWIVADRKGRPAFIHVREESGADGTTPFTVKDDEAKIIPMTRPLIEFVLEHKLHRRKPYLIAPEIRGGKHTYRWDYKRRLATYIKAELPGKQVTTHTFRHTFVTLLLSAPPEKRPSLLHLERWTGDNVETLKKHYAHLIEDVELINAAN